MEMSKYSKAEKYFRESLEMEPYRLEGVEYYTVCLWHLKKPVELTYLAYNCLEKSVFAQESWIAVGNCFSLQKEHESSLLFFNRAIQLNSNNPYTHTLSAHEYVYNEDYPRVYTNKSHYIYSYSTLPFILSFYQLSFIAHY